MIGRVEPLGKQDLSRFGCGHDQLDSWLIAHARTALGQGTRIYVLVDGDGLVRGYYAIAPHLLNRAQAPPRPARGAPRLIPAILLAKLAVDRPLHGQGIGADLLVAALITIIDAARVAGGRIIVVDAIDDNVRRFYEHHDFAPVPGNDRRLVMKLSTAAKALGLDWP